MSEKSDGTTRNGSGCIESFTNDYGMMIHGNPTLQAEDGRRQAAAQEAATQEHAAAVTYENEQAAGRDEAAAAARALWAEATPEQEPQPQQERNRER